MARKAKKRITLEEAIKNVPHDWAYCLDSGRCPYWRLRKCHSKGQMITKARKAHIIGIPIWYSRRHELEYCMFLREYLSIQDGCKDCGINEYDETGNYGEEYLEQKRLKNREFADYYKEKFPEESELIDKIVEEDKLDYWYKDKN